MPHRFIWSKVEQMRISFYYNTKTFYYPDISISIKGLHQKRHWITIQWVTLLFGWDRGWAFWL